MSAVRTDSDGRTPDGRFGPGNRLSGGNPNARRLFELRKALLDSADADDVRRVGRRLLALAEDGDVQAAKLWLENVVGKPAQAIELSGPDGEPLGVDWGRLQAVLLGALSRFPEARVQVALALRGLADDNRDAERAGDGTRPEPPDGGPGSDPGPLAEGCAPLDG